MEIRYLKAKQKQLQKQNQEAEETLNNLTAQIGNAQNKLTEILVNINSQKHKLEEAKNEYNKFLKETEGVYAYEELEEIGFEYTEKLESLDTVESNLISIEQQIGLIVKSNNHLTITRTYIIDKSVSKGLRFQSNYGKNLIIGLNAIYNKLIKSKNITLFSAKDKLNRAYEKYNKQGNIIGIKISQEYYSLLVTALELKYQLREAKRQQQEKIRKEKQRLKEQEQLLAEAEKEKKQLEQERKAMNIAFAKSLTEEERVEIKNKLVAIDKRISDIDYRINNKQAGYVYVISSPALKGMVKIGSTRRLNPTIRVKELSSSSLPYPFVVHGFVFSDDCFELEAKLHRYFNYCRVHKDREFFYAEPKEVIEVLKNKFNCDIYFENEESSDEL